MRTVLYPGSFDPVTAGHMDIIARAAQRFDRVIVGILHNPQKPSGAFTPEERALLLEAATSHLPQVEIRLLDGLLVDAVRACGAEAVLRGIRGGADVEAEMQMARLNRQLAGVETLMMAASPDVVHISASMVREIGRLGGNLRGMVPDTVLASIENALCNL